MNLSAPEKEDLIKILHARFEQNMNRHEGILWSSVLTKLDDNKLWSLSEMERTGGEPDVVCFDTNSKELAFCDCSKESPAGRRSLCYDLEAWESRKKYKPASNAIEAAHAMGISITTEWEYLKLQTIENFDTKTSSWLKTPDAVRKLGGALFGDYRFGKTFIYHNGAESYYGGRGFRGILSLCN